MGFLSRLLGLGPKKKVLDLIQQQQGTFIDVRQPHEFQAEHHLGSTNIPLPEIAKSMEKIKQLPPPYILVCRSGARSAMAAQQLKQAGLEAYNGGAWQNLEK